MYDFFKTLTLIDTGRLKAPKTKNPTGLTLRVFANGEVYPSEELVKVFELEYKTVDSKHTGDCGYGFDIIDSKQWKMLESAPRMIMFGHTKKDNPKVDLFAGVRYDAQGNPKSSVLTQGTKSEILLNLVKDLGYLTDEQKYVDLQIVIDYPVKTEDGLAYIPKVIERGENKGQMTYIKRENVTFYPVNTVENLKAITTDTKKEEPVPAQTVKPIPVVLDETELPF